MAQGSVLTRRLMLCSRTQAPCSISTPCRALSSSSVRPSAKVPTLSDLNSQSAPAFEAKQQQFRANLKDAKAKADRQSLEFSSTSSAPSRTSRGHLNETPDESDGLALGSLSTDDAGEAREHARSQDSTSSASSKKKGGAFQSLIYGTEEGREMDREMERSFSQVLARGKYVHSIVFHEVKPDKVEEYVDLVGGWYPKVASMPQNKVNLVGSWRTEVGDCDTFVHIWEYQRYHGYHDSLYNIQHLPEFAQFDSKLKSLIHSKKTSLMQEFSFWPTTPPRELGGLFELRSYELHPGNLLEWETHWRKGLEARREVMEGVGAWFVQVGELNTVHHLWQFADLEERKLGRERSWAVEGWSDTVHKTVPLIQTMKSRILIPMPWSPVR